MKRHHRWVFVAGVAILGGLAGKVALAQAGRAVAMTVNVATDTKRKGQGSSGVQTTQEKTLQIALANLTAQEFPAIRIKYYVFGKAADSKKISVARSGEEQVKLAAQGKAKVESAMVPFAFTDQHTEKVGKSYMSVPAAGDKYAGYAIQVYNADKLLTEAIEPPDLKPVFLVEMQKEDKETKEEKDSKEGDKKKDKGEKAH